MRYLLLAPAKRHSSPHGVDVHSEDGRADGAERPSLRSRFDFDTRDLAQKWEELPTGQVMTNDHIDGGYQIDRAALCWERGCAVLALEVSASGSVQGELLDLLEAELTDIATAYAQQHMPTDHRELSWVGRTVLCESRDQVHDDWISDGAQEVTLGGMARGVHARSVTSWGNGLIEGDRNLDDEAWRQAVRGMVDAQVLWNDISAISDLAASHARNRLVHGTRTRKEMKIFLDAIEQLIWGAAQHNLAFDEMKLVIQGNRKTACMAWLDSWGYDEMVERVERRLQDLESVAHRRSERLNARYQGSIELILLALGTLTLIEVSLSAVSAAFGGGVSALPGGSGEWGILAAVRDTGGDPLIIVAALMMIIGAMWLWRTKRVAT